MNLLIRDLSEPSRRAILSELLGGPRSVSDLVRATQLKQPNVSNHLAKLRSRGVLIARKRGRSVEYSLANGDVVTVIQAHLAHTAAPRAETSSFQDATSQYVQSAVSGDEHHCAAIIQGLLSKAHSLLTIYENVLNPAMHEVGNQYVAKVIDEAQEHMASAITERMMAKVVQFTGRPTANHRKVLLGCVPGNFHTIGLQMISDYMRLTGWNAIFLGANVPNLAFKNAVLDHKPDLVLTSVAVRDDIPHAVELLALLRDTGVVLGVGGNAVIDASQEMKRAGADFICTSLREFAEEILPSVNAHAAID